MTSASGKAGPAHVPGTHSRLLAFCALYGVSAFGAMFYLVSDAGLPAIWPASGVFLAALLMTPRAQWGLFAISLGLVDYILETTIGSVPLLLAAIYSACLTLQAIVSALLILRYSPKVITFSRLSDGLSILVWGCIVPVAIFALPPALANLALLGNSWFSTWISRSITGCLGVLVVTPLLLSWSRKPAQLIVQMSATRWAEFSLALLILTALTWLVFTLKNPQGAAMPPFNFAPVLVLALILIAVRYELVAVTLASFVLSATAIWTDATNGAAAAAITFRSLLALQPFLIFATGCAILAACVTRERRLANAILQESQSRYRLAISSARDGVWDWNFLTKKLFISPQGRKIFGYENEGSNDQIDAQIEDFEHADHIHPDDLARVRASINSTITDPDLTLDIEFRFRHRDGRWIDIHCTGAMAADDSGAPARFAGTHTDVTERNALEAAVRQSQKMDSVGQLTGGIAHDFNNLLSIVIGNLDLLRLKAGNLPKDQTVLIERALFASERGAALTNKLLGFSSMKPAKTVSFNVNSCINSMQHLLAKSLTPSIRLDLNLADDLWNVQADQGEFENMILNLALNASDSMPNGGSLIIETDRKVIDENYAHQNPGSRTGQFVMIAVSDTGTGMSEEVRSHAFEPFFTTKSPGQGTGLGLSMVYGFIQRSSGHCKIYSEIDSGSTVRVYLPRAMDPEINETEEDTALPHRPRGTETILIVDDENAMVNFTATYLSELGYSTIKANSAGQALEILASNPGIDLLFTDIIMPGDMDGYELAYQAHKAQLSLRILLTSGYTGRREKWLGRKRVLLERLTSSLLSKPYNLDELACSIRNALDEQLPG